MKKITLVLLTAALIFALISCGATETPHCTEHVDNDADNKCDACSEVINTETDNTKVALISDGQINFQIVRAMDADSGIMTLLNPLKSTVEKLGSSLQIVSDKVTNETDIEVLIGDVTSRGEEYKYDKYSLGSEGYIIKKIGNKIIINGGSSTSLILALETFIEDILGIKSEATELKDVTIEDSQSVVEIQSGYRITSIEINGIDIRGYTIAFDIYNSAHLDAATELNNFLYTKAGYYLPLVDISKADKSIIIESVKDAGEDGFRVRSDDNDSLHIECAYSNAFSSAFANFLNNELRLKDGDIDFDSSYNYTEVVNVVYYEDFMHLSVDGNDYLAIKAAHDYANKGGQTVKAGRNKKYTITDICDENGKYAPIVIKTNVDWGNAEILIDDTSITNVNDGNNKNIFVVESDYEEIKLTRSQIAEMFPDGISASDTTQILWNYDFPALVVVINSGHKNYIRYGGNANNGANQKELIIVDKNGNLDPTANFMFDYEKVTSVTVYRTDVEPITISGGIVTTKASRHCQKDANGNFTSAYYKRGIQVTRPNTTLKGIKHYVTNEVESAPNDKKSKGPAYSGFFTTSATSNVYIIDCVLTARRYYKIAGTYDFNANTTNNIVLKNCTQSNFYLLDEDGNPTETLSMAGSMYWGVGGTNYCKNMVYDGCELTRYDAHSGVHNGKIINSKVTAINLIGAGDMLIENCDLEPTSTNIITLRSDYGSTWKGTVTIKNCRVKNSNTSMSIFAMTWVNHNFGYTVHMPNVVIDNLTFAKTPKEIMIFKETANKGYYTMATEYNIHEDTLKNGDKNINKVAPSEFITVINTNGYKYTLVDVPFFVKTKVSENIERKIK